QVSEFAKPIDRIPHTFEVRSSMVAKVPLSLGAAEKHMVFRHPQTVEREKRLAPRRACRELGDRRERIQQRARQSQTWTRPSGESRDVAQQVDEPNVIASKYVLLADLAAG